MILLTYCTSNYSHILERQFFYSTTNTLTFNFMLNNTILHQCKSNLPIITHFSLLLLTTLLVFVFGVQSFQANFSMYFTHNITTHPAITPRKSCLFHVHCIPHCLNHQQMWVALLSDLHTYDFESYWRFLALTAALSLHLCKCYSSSCS